MYHRKGQGPKLKDCEMAEMKKEMVKAQKKKPKMLNLALLSSPENMEKIICGPSWWAWPI